MAILVLVLWLFTAGAGFSVLISSNLKRDRPVPAAPPVPVASRSTSPAEARRARREQFDPTALVAAREAPIIPGARALLEFSHPACGIVGLAFWLAFSLVHARVFGWFGFGLAAVTACAGLSWFAINLRDARLIPDAPAPDAPAPDAPAPDAPAPDVPAPDVPPAPDASPTDAPAPDVPVPSFRGRLVALHGAAAALTVLLAALTAVVLHG